jgi:hypothetical protein
MVLSVLVLLRKDLADADGTLWRSRCRSEKFATATVVKSFALNPNPKLAWTGFLQ